MAMNVNHMSLWLLGVLYESSWMDFGGPMVQQQARIQDF